MAKPVCKDCGETRVTWQRSYKGNWYLKDEQGRPHFKHCVVKQAPVPNQPTQAEIEAANSPEVQADLVAEFQSQTDIFCVTCNKLLGDRDGWASQDQNGKKLYWCVPCISKQAPERRYEESRIDLQDNTADEIGLTLADHVNVEQQISRAKPMIVSDLMKAFNKPDAIKPNTAVRDVYRAETQTANPLPVKVQPRTTQKPTATANNEPTATANNGQPVNIPCPKCRQPNKLTFQQLTNNQTCC